MGTQDSEEFQMALKDIACHSHLLNNAFDRVRCVEWCRKLAGLSDDDLESARIKNEYIQFLRIQVRYNFLHGPFVTPPPTEQLGSLSECLGNLMAKQIPYLPRVGPIAPVLHHKSPDGRAYISTKQIPGKGDIVVIDILNNYQFEEIKLGDIPQSFKISEDRVWAH